MSRAVLILLLASSVSVGLGQDASEVKFPSPDGRFGLRVADLKVDLVERTTGKVIVDLGSLWVDRDNKSDTEHSLLVWSSDSKWVAYGTRTFSSGKTTVYCWDGSGFKELALPSKMPEPKIKPRQGDSGVKLKGYAEEPLKWINPGELQMSSKLTGIGRDVGYNYTGSILITVAFDVHRRATVKKVTDTKTEVSE